jgi:NTE family protein
LFPSRPPRPGRCRAFRSLCGVLLLTSLARAQEPEEPARPRIGLVLSGGGARGAAHLGVLKVLEELRIPVDMIAGNSMGALVAGIYAYGYSPAEMEKRVAEIDWPLVLSDASLREARTFRRKQDDLRFQIRTTLGFRLQDFEFVLPKGLIAGHRTGFLLWSLVPEAYETDDFDRLRIPYRAVACDIGTGETVVLRKGELARVMSASMAIPGVFAPVVIDGRELVDGMVVNNIPIDLAREMGADVVIAVDIGTPLLEAKQIRSLLDVTNQMVGILLQKNIDAQLASLTDADTLLRPDLGDISSASFDRVADAIRIGEEFARAHADELRRYSVSEEEYARYLEKQRRPPGDFPYIDRITVENDSRIADEVILAAISTEAGERLDPERLQGDLERIYGLEEFERVGIRLRETAPGHVEVTLVARAKSWGPSYLNFGLELEDDFQGNTSYALGARYTMRLLNSSGAEWRNEAQIGEPIRFLSEFYQPLAAGSPLFVAPLAEFVYTPFDVFVNHRKVGEYDVAAGQGGGDLGAHLGNWAELRLGYRRTVGHADPDIVTIPADGFSFDDGYLRAGLEIDTLDNTHFPTAGTHVSAEYAWADDSLGADDDYQRLEIAAGHAVSFGSNTLIAAADYGTALGGGNLPVFREVRRGGFVSLSGFQPNELTGQHGVTAKLIGYHRVSGSPLDLFGMPVYVGGSIETGSVTNDRSELLDELVLAGSFFLGVDSPLGPIYVAYGLAEGGNDSAYLFVGRTF